MNIATEKKSVSCSDPLAVLRVPSSIRDALKTLAESHQMSLQEVTELALRDFIDSEPVLQREVRIVKKDRD